MKKFISVFLIILLTFCMLILSSCSALDFIKDLDFLEGIFGHEHEYSLRYDENEHWDECDCGEKMEKSSHSFNGDVCSVCGYTIGGEVNPGVGNGGGEGGHTHKFYKRFPLYNEHCYQCDCGELGNYEEHTLVNGVCSVCNYTPKVTDGLSYTLINNGTEYEVKRGSCTEHFIRIPSTYNGKPVTKIGHGGFAKKDISTISIPNTVTEIDDYAFENVNGMDINFGKFSRLKKIGRCAFDNAGLSFFTLPRYVTDIDYMAFSMNKYLTFNFGDNKSLKTIGELAFSYCDRIGEFVIPESVESIGKNAFSGCDNIKFNIDDNFKYIGTKTNPHYYLYAHVDGYVDQCTINSSCVYIGYNGFRALRSLKSLTIPASVKRLPDFAFSDCDSLTKVYFEDNSSLKELPKAVFYECEKLEEITLPSSIDTIPTSAFYRCKALKSITFTNSIKKICEQAFAQSGLETIYFSGYKSDWNSITLEQKWNYGIYRLKVVCYDGNLTVK